MARPVPQESGLRTSATSASPSSCCRPPQPANLPSTKNAHGPYPCSSQSRSLSATNLSKSASSKVPLASGMCRRTRGSFARLIMSALSTSLNLLNSMFISRPPARRMATGNGKPMAGGRSSRSGQRSSLFPATSTVLLHQDAPQTRRVLREARDFMRHAYGRPVSLPDVAAQANLSPYHFLRVHKQAYGETPHEFLTRLRLERAKT